MENLEKVIKTLMRVNAQLNTVDENDEIVEIVSHLSILSMSLDRTVSSMNSLIRGKGDLDGQSYFRELVRLYSDLDRSGLDMDDEDSYYELHDYLESLIYELQELDSNGILSRLESERAAIKGLIDSFKESMAGLDRLTEQQMYRIKILNRIECLLYGLEAGVPEPSDAFIGKLIEKAIHAALIKGINGPNHREYLRELLDCDNIIRAMKEISAARPFIAKFGKSPSIKDCEKLCKVKGDQALDLITRALKCTPEDVLAYAPLYKTGLLTEIRYRKEN